MTIQWFAQRKQLLTEQLPTLKEKVKNDGLVYLYHEIHYEASQLKFVLTMYVRDPKNETEAEVGYV